MIEKRLSEIAQRKLEIRSQLESNAPEVNLEDVQTELETLEVEARELEQKKEIAGKINAGELEARQIEKPQTEVRKMETTQNVLETKEYRSAWVKSLLGQEMNETEKRAYSSALSSAGALIPTVVLDNVFEKIKQIAPMINEITLLRAKGNISIAVEGSRAAAALHTENGTISDSADTFVQVTLAGYEINKAVSISKAAATMSVASFEATVINFLAKDIARKIEDYIINGTGSSQPKGIAVANTWGATNQVTVATGTAVTYADLNNVAAKLAGGYDPNAKWLMSKKTLFSYITSIVDTTGQPIVVRDIAAGVGSMILGYPVILSDYVAEGEAYLGDYSTVVGNLAEDINVAASGHSGLLRNAVDYVASAIFDCKPANGEAIVRLKKTP